MTALDAFHFLRPLWLVVLPIALWLWWRVRLAQGGRDMPVAEIAPHLRAALTVGAAHRHRLRPIDGVMAAVVCLILGVAGPTWSRVPDPLVAQSAPVVVVIKVAESMDAPDIAPSRLERAKQKTRDFLDLRAGARTALVAYGGTAHVVVPMTEDPGIVVPYLEGLSPDIMPRKGDDAGAALALAQSVLDGESAPGGVLFVTDGIDPIDVAALNDSAGPLAVLAMLPEGTGDRGLDGLSATVVPVSADTADLRQLDRLLNAAYRQALLENTDQPWLDRGPWMAWPAALLILIWFRRGWTMRWAVLAACLLGATPNPGQAEGLADWFFTPDQQGQRAMNAKDFDAAAERYSDPLRRGYAMYRDGQYEAAIEILGRLDTAEAAFIQGMAHIKFRAYRDGAQAFQTALDRDPNFPGAAENLAVAERIVTYIERVRDQSDIGEQKDMGADEYRFDNDEDRGSETRTEVPKDGGAEGPMSAENWMNSVQTDTGDFLKKRFALEAAQASRGTP